jgi:hypothetical protein
MVLTKAILAIVCPIILCIVAIFPNIVFQFPQLIKTSTLLQNIQHGLFQRNDTRGQTAHREAGKYH